MSINKENFENKMKNIIKLLETIGDFIGVDLTGSVKIGKRELVIYNQEVVNILVRLQKQYMITG